MRRLFVFVTFLTCATSAFAQGNFLWQTLFGGEQYNGLKPNECPEELPSGVVSLKDGSYVVVGSSNDCSKQGTNSKVEQKKIRSRLVRKDRFFRKSGLVEISFYE